MIDQRLLILSGGRRTRTDDIRVANATLSQLSYTPEGWTIGYRLQAFGKTLESEASSRWPGKMGVPEFESGTSSLSATRSNQLSYTPAIDCRMTKIANFACDHFCCRHLQGAEFTRTRLAVKAGLEKVLPPFFAILCPSP